MFSIIVFLILISIYISGRIINYDLFQNGIIVITGMAMNYSVGGLLPYSRHLFRLRACTQQGCGSSLEVSDGILPVISVFDINVP